MATCSSSGGFVEASLRAEAGVVDEEVEPGLGGEALGDAVDVVEAREIGDKASRRRCCGRGQFGGELFETVATAGDQEKIVAAGGELAREYERQGRRMRR